MPNFTDNPKNHTLEIDGIATKNKKCYIIECKNPRLPPLVESSEARQIMARDLRGIIDGLKRTTKKGRRIVKKIPSLSDKVEFVKNNFKSIGLPKNLNSFEGVVITADFPVLDTYKNCKFCNGENIEKLFRTKNTT